ncbi:MAG: RNA polymerase sporulation sigma factor SigH [Actinomycetota bacterium]|nr:RNA polymerase sporulation sigma factor SigH [Actinomycetota bacterium]
MRLEAETPVASSTLTDEDLVVLARTGDSWALETLLVRYRNYARAKARSYFLQGGDREDIVQEGMIGLFKAIRSFQGDRQSSFRAFAELCISRQIITAIKTATRQKHIPLNSYVSLNKPIPTEDNDARSMIDVLPTLEASDPLEILMNTADFASLKTCFDEILSGLEGEVLLLYLEGRSYQEIAENLGRHVKSIDNALQRIKRKIETHLMARSRENEEDEAVLV